MADDPLIIYPKWQTELMGALAETDPDKMLERVEEAQKAMSKRFWAISRSTSHEAEIEAIQKAMNTLEVLGERLVSRRRPEYEGLGQPVEPSS